MVPAYGGQQTSQRVQKSTVPACGGPADLAASIDSIGFPQHWWEEVQLTSDCHLWSIGSCGFVLCWSRGCRTARQWRHVIVVMWLV